ncbi:MAG: APC family permease [Gemmatimonadota bacterium]
MTAGVPAALEPAPPPGPTLLRALGTRDGALITIGSIVGTGIFITTGDMARSLPHAELLLLVWLAGGLLTLAGALTYGELGALFPRAGGVYHFLKEAYGPVPGFLYGWACFLVIFSGGIAALAVGFGEYLGSFVPFFSGDNVLVAVGGDRGPWVVNGRGVAAALAIVLLTAINAAGLREGAGVQNVLTAIKILLLVGLAALGLLLPSAATGTPVESPASALTVSAFGVAMIGALWAYDGWYNLPMLAGEMKEPARSLPRGLALGTAAVVLLYVLSNLFYLRALPMSAVAGNSRIAEAAGGAVLGAGGARLVSAAVVVSTFGCLAANILAGSRIYLAMARDGLFFRSLARIDPVHRVPARSLWAQSGVALVLALSGSYEQLYTYVTFAVVLFNAATGMALFVLRRTRADLPRPYRAWGYPVVPALFVLATAGLVVNTLIERPVESGIGLALVALGLPAYAFWRSSPIAGSTESEVATRG